MRQLVTDENILPIASVKTEVNVIRMPLFSLTLDEETANRVTSLVKPFGGSVGGYAARIVSDLSRLPIDEQEELREMIRARVKRHAERSRSPEEVARH